MVSMLRQIVGACAPIALATAITVAAFSQSTIFSWAQEGKVGEGDLRDANPSREQSEKAPETSVSVDELLGELARETNSATARRLEKMIWRRWTQSGSPTIDALMEWSAKAIKDKDYGAALDLLDQVTLLSPGYVEGWNRRATLFFIKTDYARSIADIEQVLKIEPRHFGALAGLGNILGKLQQDRKALEIWREVLEVYPANEVAQKTLIRLEEKLADPGT